MELVAVILIVASSIGVSLLLGTAMIYTFIAMMTRTRREPDKTMPFVPAGSSPTPAV